MASGNRQVDRLLAIQRSLGIALSQVRTLPNALATVLDAALTKVSDAGAAQRGNPVRVRAARGCARSAAITAAS